MRTRWRGHHRAASANPATFDAVERLFEANSDVSAELVALLDRNRGEIVSWTVFLGLAACALVAALCFGLLTRQPSQSSARG